MPLVPHQCCGPAAFTVAFAFGAGFDAEAATDETALPETRANVAAVRTAERPIPSARLIGIPSSELITGHTVIRLRIERPQPPSLN